MPNMWAAELTSQVKWRTDTYLEIKMREQIGKFLKSGEADEREINPPYDCHEVCIGEGLAPQQVGDDGGQDEAGHEEALEVVAVLEHEERVRLKVRHVDRLPCLHHGRVFPAEKRAQHKMFHKPSLFLI